MVTSMKLMYYNVRDKLIKKSQINMKLKPDMFYTADVHSAMKRYRERFDLVAICCEKRMGGQGRLSHESKS